MLQNTLGALAQLLDAASEMILAMSYGFAAFPTALAFFIGTAGMLVFGQVNPVSVQAESIITAGTLGKDRQERLSIVLLSGALMALLGSFGMLGRLVGLIGPEIHAGMMAGVGIMLARAGMDLIKADPVAGGVSAVTGAGIYLLTENLIYTVCGCVVLSAAAWNAVQAFRRRHPSGGTVEPADIDTSHEKLERIHLKLTPGVLKGVLAMCTLQTGGNIAYAAATGALAGRPANVDLVTLYCGLGSAASALFGGAPVGTVISATAAAVNPALCAAVFMALMAAVLLARIIPKTVRYIPSQSMAGLTLVVGIFLLFPGNARTAFAGNPLVASATILLSAAADPFAGMASGLLLQRLLG